MTVHIRQALQADVPACVDILLAWVDEIPWGFEMNSREEVLAAWREFFAQFEPWVAEANGAIVGFCVRNDDNITGLYVSASARNQGVGKRLLDEAKKDRDWITVWAYAKNVHALRFYKREGLVERSREIEEGSNLVDIEHRWTRS